MALLVAALALAGCSSGKLSPASSATVDASPAASASRATGEVVLPTVLGPPLSSAALLKHAVKPVLADDDAGGLLLATEPGSARDTRPVVAAFRNARGRWGKPVVLARDSDRGAPTVAAGGDGRAVVGWTTFGARAMTESVRIRGPQGRWTQRHVVARDSGSTTMTDLDMNRRGDVAALAANGELFRVVRHSVGGRWTTTRLPGCTAGTLALDDRGVVHVACVGFADRGEQGMVRLWAQRRGGPLVLERRLGRAVSVAVQVAPDGRETVTLGTGVPGAEVVAASTFTVLHQASPDAPLSAVWSHARTRTALATVADDRLLVAWEELRGRRPRTATLLRVRTVLPVTGPVTTVHRDASPTVGHGDFDVDFDLAVPATGPGVLLWRVWQNETHSRVNSIRLTPLVGRGTGTTVVLPGGARNVVDQFLTDREQVAVSSVGRIDLTWLHDAVTRRRPPSGDPVTIDGTVQVARTRRRS
ncbi:MAG: hypothetical protein ABI776_14825 [Nocardioidaceae bacterium]